ncbi:MAG: P1 family peptidase [Clostridia bacterium]|jgi:L-aminopeptidase/D-esterase-like protein|nr:P1 family peptidase [Clostridia bacterium]MBT7122108.1 P1 family peptidase [Clostridia bacterium]
MYKGSITDIEGVSVGHYTDAKNKTGCSVVIIDNGGVCGVDVRGSAPGTRETDLMRPTAMVQKANAFVLSGGSAFGLASADGVMRYLEENGQGFDTGVAKVPIVGAAVLFDLAVGSADVRPTADNGYTACQNAVNDVIETGKVGAGTGATTGKAAGKLLAGKGGFGTASISLGGGIVVAACFAVNAFGDIYDHTNGEKIAGMKGMKTYNVLLKGAKFDFSGKNTTIGVVGTNAILSKEQANKLAQLGQDGIALSVRPSHTMFDGDTVFAFGTGQKKSDINAILAAGAEVAARAIENAVSKS